MMEIEYEQGDGSPFLLRFLHFSDPYRSRSPLRTQAFKFSAPKQMTTQEVAIIQVKGVFVHKNAMAPEAMQRMRQVVDANRQALVHACFRKMEIPTEVWADAIDPLELILDIRTRRYT